MATEFEITARWKKATVLAAHLYANGITSQEIDRLSVSDWGGVATGLGQNKPSVQTIQVVREVLGIIESAVAQKIAEQAAKEKTA